MKSNTTRTTHLILWIPLYLMYKKSKKRLLAITLFLAITVSSCYQHYYRSHTESSTNADVLQRLQSSNKYFIVHFPDRNVGLQNVAINQNNLEGNEVLLSAEHNSELNPNQTGANAMKKHDRDSVLVEVHLYTSNNSPAKGRLSIPVTDINRIDVYEYDRKATRLNHTLSTVGIVASGIVLVSLATLAVACNCPQVYVEDSGNARFNGGMYSGAIYSTLERTDYMPLPIVRTTDNKLKLTVRNAPEEEQFINNMQLLQVNHNTTEKVLVDRHGNIVSYKNPRPPFLINSGNASLAANPLIEKDGQAFMFNNTSNQSNSEIILKFKKDINSRKAKLIINARNSTWSGYIFKEFSSLFGESAASWRSKQEKSDPETLNNWQKKQSLPLMVYVKKGNSWKFVDYFPLTGNTATRDMVMQFDLEKNNDDVLEIKLESVFRFWDLDYAALDLSETLSPMGMHIEPTVARNNKGADQRDALLKKDALYSQLTNDDAVSFEFDLPKPALDNTVSYFLVSSGYYHSLATYAGKAKMLDLLQFRKAGGFNNFSKKKYQQVNDELAKYAISKPVDK